MLFKIEQLITFKVWSDTDLNIAFIGADGI